MLSRVLLLCLGLLGTAVSSGCALVGDPCATPVTGTATYVSSSVPPPHHYEWTVQLEASSGTITFTPGYDSDVGWTEAFTPDAGQVVDACRRLQDQSDSTTAPGGGTLTLAWCGASGRATSLKTSGTEAAEIVRAAVPADAWARAQGAYEQWQQTVRR